MTGRLLCALGLHKFKGTPVPHTYQCVREHRVWSHGTAYPVYRQCQAVEAGYP